MKPSRTLQALLLLQTVPAAAVILFLCLALGLVGYVDLVTGPDYPFSLFYILLAGAAAVRFRLGPGLGIAAGILLVWTVVAFWPGTFPMTLASLLWTLVIRYLTLALLVYLVTALQATITELSFHALKDPLTGASNRRHFDDFLERVIRVSRRYNRPLTVASFDIDDFKSLNDRFGHHHGDQVLVTVASEILQRIRPEDLLARLGGDEFVLVLPDSEFEQAHEVLSRVFSAVDEGLRDRGLGATLSIGAISFPVAPEDPAVLLKEVDALLYRVKREGKGVLRHLAFSGENA